MESMRGPVPERGMEAVMQTTLKKITQIGRTWGKEAARNDFKTVACMCGKTWPGVVRKTKSIYFGEKLMRTHFQALVRQRWCLTAASRSSPSPNLPEFLGSESFSSPRPLTGASDLPSPAPSLTSPAPAYSSFPIRQQN